MSKLIQIIFKFDNIKLYAKEETQTKIFKSIIFLTIFTQINKTFENLSDY